MKHHYVTWAIAAVAGIAGFTLWHRSELAVARAEEHAKAQDEVIKASKDAISQIEKAAKDANEALERERAKPATIQTVTKFLPMPLPAGSEVKVEQLPNAPAPQIVLSGDVQKNLDFIQTLEIEHLKCDKNLEACGATNAEQTKQIQALTDKSKTWEQTARGGSKLHRFGKALKVVGCAAGGAGLGAILGKTKGAAIGGAAGAGACQLIW